MQRFVRMSLFYKPNKSNLTVQNYKFARFSLFYYASKPF